MKTTTNTNPLAETLQGALDALEAGDRETCTAILKGLLEAPPATAASRLAAAPKRRARTIAIPSTSLTASELAECKRAGADPKVFARNKARRAARKAGR